MSKLVDKCLPFFLALQKIRDFKWTEECQKAFKGLKEYLSQSPLLNQPKPSDKLKLYLTVSQCVISVVLFREVEGKQRLVYYISQVMVDVETKYTQAEQLILGFVIIAQKLIPCFQAYVIEVLSNLPLRSTM